MKPLSHTLNDLTDYAAGLVARPRYSAPGIGGDLGAMAAAVREADRRPAEGVRTTRAAMIMINAIEAYHATDRESGAHWLMIVGVTLPVLRDEAWQALSNEREARGSS
jgi:hypothetical protein